LSRNLTNPIINIGRQGTSTLLIVGFLRRSPRPSGTTFLDFHWLLLEQLPRFFFVRVVDFAHHADQVSRFFVLLEAPGQRAFREQLAVNRLAHDLFDEAVQDYRFNSLGCFHNETSSDPHFIPLMERLAIPLSCLTTQTKGLVIRRCSKISC
jgi:hypothetical protein